MKRDSIFTILLLIVCNFTFSQVKNKSLTLKEVREIESRAIDLEMSIFLGDSLYQHYNIDESDENIDTDCLALIHRLYIQSENFGCKDDFIIKRKVYIEGILKERVISYSKEQYQKVVDKAEELFLEGNYKKAHKLYSRAKVFRPSDKKVKKRLKKINKLIKKKGNS